MQLVTIFQNHLLFEHQTFFVVWPLGQAVTGSTCQWEHDPKLLYSKGRGSLNLPFCGLPFAIKLICGGGAIVHAQLLRRADKRASPKSHLFTLNIPRRNLIFSPVESRLAIRLPSLARALRSFRASRVWASSEKT